MTVSTIIVGTPMYHHGNIIPSAIAIGPSLIQSSTLLCRQARATRSHCDRCGTITHFTGPSNSLPPNMTKFAIAFLMWRSFPCAPGTHVIVINIEFTIQLTVSRLPRHAPPSVVIELFFTTNPRFSIVQYLVRSTDKACCPSLFSSCR